MQAYSSKNPSTQEELHDIPGCVYAARCRVNGKYYVGKTVYTLSKRRHKHEGDAHRKGRTGKAEGDRIFHRALRKYGPKAFDWEPIHFSNDEAELFERERYFVKMLDSKVPNGYNLTDGGDGRSGFTCSDATKAKMSASQKGKKKPPGFGAKMSAALKGNVPWNKGKKLTQEHIDKMRAAKTGVPLSAEHKAKISAAHKGKVKSPEHRAALGDAHRGKAVSAETRAKLSAALKGRPTGRTGMNAPVKAPITYQGRTMILKEWAEELGMTRVALRYRITHWGLERAFSTPRANYPKHKGTRQVENE